MGARELQALLREIKNVRSPVQRMKLMALAWRTVARLTPAERKELGSKLGVRGFERVLARLGPGPKGIAPAEVLRALDGADELDPSKLRGLVRGIRDPEKRKQLLRQGLDFLDRSLDEAEPDEIEDEEELEVAGVPEPIRSPEPLSIEPPGLEPLVVVPAAAVEPPEPEAQSAEPDDVAPVAEPDEGPSVETVEEPDLEPGRPPATEIDEEERTASEEVERIETTPVEPTPIPARPAIPVAAPLPLPTRPSPAREALRDMGGATEAAPRLIARFRSLRRDLDDNGEMEIEAIRTLLAGFPEGWARRRAVMSLLRQGQPSSLDDALDVIGELERPTDRRWACATLIDSRELSDEDARRIADRFPFPSLTRRLRRRFGSALHGE
jgi:hypothetical protein